MTSPLAHQERVAIARLHALLELLPTALDRHLAPAGITSFEYTLLEALAEAEGGALRMSALAAKTNATLPRLSRVVSALERRGLVERSRCAEDGRATNAVLTPEGRTIQRESSDRYTDGARTLILDGLAGLPDGVQQLTDLSYAILSVLDPEHRLDVTARKHAPVCTADPAESPGSDGSDGSGACAADPAPACAADPETPECAADPEPRACAADPEPRVCNADPKPAMSDV